jgi:serine-type D-Ala-D-Ala carboxypeptidase (penicillin-binding protein 5/6)
MALVATLAILSPGPARASSDSGPRIASAGAAIADASSGGLLWGLDAQVRRPIASLTKVMTALVVLRAGHLGRRIRVPDEVVAYVSDHGASNAGLRAGDVLTARELLAALLLPSGADAAYALALAYGPGLDRFVARMNATARSLGLTGTYFTNSDGLPYPSDDSDYSTPADVIRLGRAAMRSAVFRSLVRRRYFWLPAGAGHRDYLWLNDNPLLGSYRGAIGIKTGWTPFAGRCLLFEAERAGRWFIGVTLDSGGTGATGSGAAAARMLDWAFARPAPRRPRPRVRPPVIPPVMPPVTPSATPPASPAPTASVGALGARHH